MLEREEEDRELDFLSQGSLPERGRAEEKRGSCALLILQFHFLR